MRSRSIRWALLTVLVATAASCGGDQLGDGGDEAGDGAPVDSGGDGDETGDGSGPRGGPATFVVRHVEVLVERLCDVDGDGREDNAVAELGNPNAELFAVAIDAAFSAAIQRGGRVVLHFPRIDDLAVPEDDDTVLVVLDAVDADEPVNRENDFDGDGAFYARSTDLDPCGEPLHLSTGLAIEEGSLATHLDAISLPMEGSPLQLSRVTVSATIEPEGAAIVAEGCGYAPIEQLGGVEGFPDGAGLSFLEELSAGGAFVGMPTLPGLAPDVDIDGDGLERFVLDAEGRIESCIDGDLTPIAGRDCWLDGRIADGYSLSLRMEGVPARVAGRAPGWEYRVPHTCEGGPPEESLLEDGRVHDGACVGVDEICDPWLDEPCCDEADRCTGAVANEYRCRPPCEAVSCEFGPFLGVCRPQGSSGLSFCSSVGDWFTPSDCEPGTEGCRTVHGVETGTQCFYVTDETSWCAELCPTPTAECADDAERVCVPLAFEEGGVCVTRNEPMAR